MLQKKDGRYEVYGNPITERQSRAADAWKDMLAKKFNYDPNEKFNLTVEDHPYGSEIFGLKNIVRDGSGKPVDKKKGVIVSTIRMGFGHYRIAMAGVSAAKAMGFTPYWLDLLGIPGISTDVINWCNTNYSKYSRISQRYPWFDKYVWESLTTGEPTLPGVDQLFNYMTSTWPWRVLKTEVKDFKMSELFNNLYGALPSDMPILTSHMWNCMGAVAGGMTNVVDMMFDNWPMAFQLTEGAKHAVQSPSGYYGFRVMRGFDDKGKILNEAVEHSVKGGVGTIKSRNKWVGADGTVHMTDETTISFRGDGDARFIDYEVTLKAPAKRRAAPLLEVMPTPQSAPSSRPRARWKIS